MRELFDTGTRKTKQNVVNVASVPHRSLFRYPGGKTWFVPRLRRWLSSLPTLPEHFVEPFLGGGICSLTVACEALAKKVVCAEIDPGVAAVWRVSLSKHWSELAERIEGFEFTLEQVQELLSIDPISDVDVAFQTIVKNRANHGGILAKGSGLMKAGESGKGIASRWYPRTLVSRLHGVHAVASKIEFVECDGLDLIRQYSSVADTACFVDPPYTAPGKSAGRRLYTHHTLNHEALFELASSFSGELVMTYDNASSVKQMADSHNLSFQEIPMKNTHNAIMSELVVGNNLHWVEPTPS